MPQISIAKLFDDNHSRLQLSWCAGEDGADKKIDSEFTKDSSKGLIGHLNFIHPNLIQVLGVSEIQHLDGMASDTCADTLQEVATRISSSLAHRTCPPCCWRRPRRPPRRCW